MTDSLEDLRLTEFTEAFLYENKEGEQAVYFGDIVRGSEMVTRDAETREVLDRFHYVVRIILPWPMEYEELGNWLHPYENNGLRGYVEEYNGAENLVRITEWYPAPEDEDKASDVDEPIPSPPTNDSQQMRFDDFGGESSGDA